MAVTDQVFEIFTYGAVEPQVMKLGQTMVKAMFIIGTAFGKDNSKRGKFT